MQRSGSLARRNQATQLAYGTLLLLPWLVGIFLVVQLPAIGYAAGMGWGRRKAGLQTAAATGDRRPAP